MYIKLTSTYITTNYWISKVNYEKLTKTLQSIKKWWCALAIGTSHWCTTFTIFNSDNIRLAYQNPCDRDLPDYDDVPIRIWLHKRTRETPLTGHLSHLPPLVTKLKCIANNVTMYTKFTPLAYMQAHPQLKDVKIEDGRWEIKIKLGVFGISSCLVPSLFRRKSLG